MLPIWFCCCFPGIFILAPSARSRVLPRQFGAAGILEAQQPATQQQQQQQQQQRRAKGPKDRGTGELGAPRTNLHWRWMGNSSGVETPLCAGWLTVARCIPFWPTALHCTAVTHSTPASQVRTGHRTRDVPAPLVAAALMSTPSSARRRSSRQVLAAVSVLAAVLLLLLFSTHADAQPQAKAKIGQTHSTWRDDTRAQLPAGLLRQRHCCLLLPPVRGATAPTCFLAAFSLPSCCHTDVRAVRSAAEMAVAKGDTNTAIRLWSQIIGPCTHTRHCRTLAPWRRCARAMSHDACVVVGTSGCFSSCVHTYVLCLMLAFSQTPSPLRLCTSTAPVRT
jgi:hypothetical protein